MPQETAAPAGRYRTVGNTMCHLHLSQPLTRFLPESAKRKIHPTSTETSITGPRMHSAEPKPKTGRRRPRTAPRTLASTIHSRIQGTASSLPNICRVHPIQESSRVTTCQGAVPGWKYVKSAIRYVVTSSENCNQIRAAVANHIPASRRR
jgi:hypothetical protein